MPPRTSYLQSRPRASFGPVEFPVESCSVKLSVRRHIHEYWKIPGGDREKGGRKLYDISMVALMFDFVKGYKVPLIPDAVDQLRRMIENEETQPLSIPNLGIIQACADKASFDMHYTLQDGEKVMLEFQEDGSNLAALDPTTRAIVQGLALSAAADQLAAIRAANPFADPRGPSLFDSIGNIVNTILALKDQADLAQSLIVSKIASLTALCKQADNLTDLQSPTSWPVMRALHDLWFSAIQLGKDIATARQPLQTFTLPRRLSIQECSIAIYNTTSRSVELLQLNDVADAYAIPGGTTLKYYEAA